MPSAPSLFTIILVRVVVLTLVLGGGVDLVRDVVGRCLAITDILETLGHITDQHLVLIACNDASLHQLVR